MQRFSQAFGSLVFVLFRRPLILKGSCQSFLEIELFSIDLFSVGSRKSGNIATKTFAWGVYYKIYKSVLTTVNWQLLPIL